ncbi:MAG TPA: peptidylprolyl isomerase [Candidatus Acidoferrum sp.]|nr:peptidylprolyl isomerase [Candidatus Acidoferrum sp.]
MRNVVILKTILAACLMAVPLAAQDPKQDPKQEPAPQQPTLEKPQMAAPEAPAATPAPKPKPAAVKPNPEGGQVVEEIIARVNNEIITRSEYDKSMATTDEETRQDCQGKCTPEQLQTELENRKKTALRDLIDQSLLAQRGKDLGISVETDVVKQLDQIRQQNKIGSMDDLEKAVSSQGLNWEDFKNNIRNRILTQKVVSQEVGSHISIGESDAQKYYEAHKSEFVRPEQVALREIIVFTEGKKDSELPDLKKKAETALQRVKDGEDFGEIAKRLSDGTTKEQGGYIGTFKRGELAKQLEDVVFKMKRNELTDVIETKQGYLVFQVLEHYDEGEQSFEKVKSEIMDHLYNEKLEPAVREYLKTLREQSYVVIKPGYAELAGGGNSEILEVNATPEATKVKKGHKKFLLFGKRSSGQ